MDGSGTVTHRLMLGLARKMSGALATFDRTIPIAAVKGIKSDQIAVIKPEAD